MKLMRRAALPLALAVPLLLIVACTEPTEVGGYDETGAGPTSGNGRSNLAMTCSQAGVCVEYIWASSGDFNSARSQCSNFAQGWHCPVETDARVCKHVYETRTSWTYGYLNTIGQSESTFRQNCERTEGTYLGAPPIR